MSLSIVSSSRTVDYMDIYRSWFNYRSFFATTSPLACIVNGCNRPCPILSTHSGSTLPEVFAFSCVKHKDTWASSSDLKPMAPTYTQALAKVVWTHRDGLCATSGCGRVAISYPVDADGLVMAYNTSPWKFSKCELCRHKPCPLLRDLPSSSSSSVQAPDPETKQQSEPESSVPDDTPVILSNPENNNKRARDPEALDSFSSLYRGEKYARLRGIREERIVAQAALEEKERAEAIEVTSVLLALPLNEHQTRIVNGYTDVLCRQYDQADKSGQRHVIPMSIGEIAVIARLRACQAKYKLDGAYIRFVCP